MVRFFHDDALGKLIVRVTLGALLLFHGVAKVMQPGTVAYIADELSMAGFPTFLAYGVFVGEVIAPLMLIVGVYSRYAAILVIINMIFAILLVHSGELFALTKNGGWRLEVQGFFLFTAVAVLFLGSGRYAVKSD